MGSLSNYFLETIRHHTFMLCMVNIWHFLINSLNVIEGDLPPRASKLVLEWAEKYQAELKRIWETQEFKKLPPLE